MILDKLDAKNKKILLDFLRESPMCVLGSVHPEGQPQGALVAFAEYENLDILFETFKGTRKAHNLAHNQRVSLTTGFDTIRHITVQIDGYVRKVPRSEYEACIAHFNAKETPCGEEFLRDPRVEFYILTPTWIRYSDYNVDPNIFEVKL